MLAVLKKGRTGLRDASRYTLVSEPGKPYLNFYNQGISPLARYTAPLP